MLEGHHLCHMTMQIALISLCVIQYENALEIGPLEDKHENNPGVCQNYCG